MKRPPFRLEQLSADHPVHACTCGSRPGAAEIDEYLRSSALAEQSAGLSSVWVAVNPATSDEADVIAGFFALSLLSIQISPAVLGMLGVTDVPYRTVGGYLLGRLGVAQRRQGGELGGALVAAAIAKARKAQQTAGGAFVAVDAKNEGLARWYESLDLGFRTIEPGNRRLVLRL